MAGATQERTLWGVGSSAWFGVGFAPGPRPGAPLRWCLPGVLIVDFMMPGLSGLEVTRQVQQRFPRTRVLN